MAYGFSALTKFGGFGFGWSGIRTFPVPVFAGIEQLEIVGGGCLKATWEISSNTTNYNIYVRPDGNDVFQNEFLLASLKNTATSIKFRTLADGITLLNAINMTYVGVKAENSIGEDINTEVLRIRPATFSENYWINDRHIKLVV